MKIRKRSMPVLLAVLFSYMLVFQIPVNAEELPGKTYYIDASGGSDSASGLEPSCAWKTLDKVNGMVFQPGDKILLKAGETWEGKLSP